VIYLKFIISDIEHMCNYSYYTQNKSSYIIACMFYVSSHPEEQKNCLYRMPNTRI